jgi:hypothetical protein
MGLPEFEQHDRPPREAVAERLHNPADSLARQNQLELEVGDDGAELEIELKS